MKASNALFNAIEELNDDRVGDLLRCKADVHSRSAEGHTLIGRAAELLGIHRKTLLDKRKRHGHD